MELLTILQQLAQLADLIPKLAPEKATPDTLQQAAPQAIQSPLFKNGVPPMGPTKPQSTGDSLEGR